MARPSLIVSGLVLVLALLAGSSFLYTPMPEGVSESGKVQIILAGLRVVKVVATLLTYVGTHNYIENMKWMMENGLSHEFESAQFGDVEVSHASMAGVPVVIYKPVGIEETSAPATVFFHGGGFVLMSAQTYDYTTYHIARGTNTIVISVDYRLAPDHPFPAAVHDCLNVTRHVLEQGHKYGIDVDRVGLAGDSAGGNLAAVVSLQLTSQSESYWNQLPSLKYQALFYPLLQAVDFNLPSYINNNEVTPDLIDRDFITFLLPMYFGVGHQASYYGPIMSSGRHITEQARKKFSKHVNSSLLQEDPNLDNSNRGDQSTDSPKPKYRDDLKQKPDKAESSTKDVSSSSDDFKFLVDKITSPLFSPFFSPDVHLAPPTFLHVAEFDVLRDDGLLYARKLRDAGVKVETYYSKGGVHGEITKLGLQSLDFACGEAALQKMYGFVKSTLSEL